MRDEAILNAGEADGAPLEVFARRVEFDAAESI